MRFEWDPIKAESNWQKHGVSFEQAVETFDDPLQLRWFDKAHSSTEEEREVLIGRINNGGLLTIVFIQYGHVRRLISARKTTRPEKSRYYENEKAFYNRP